MESQINPTISYDMVELPSQGIYYEDNKKSLKVAYLTAADENILTSPNLIKNNKVITELLKRKILNKDFNIEELVNEDKQAILIFLRNTAWGSDYKIKTKDPKTKKEFEVEIDLSRLKTKDFNLISDDNGEYPYTFKKSNKKITFKFLTNKEEEEIDNLEQNWEGHGLPPISTKKLEMLIKSIEGDRNPMTIRNFIETLPIKDSQDFKKYVENHKPGLDLTEKVKTPSGEIIQVEIGFGVEFFRPFFGI